MKAASVLETIGNTPHIRLSRLFADNEVWVKSERANPGASIKDRIALAMIEDAEASGKLKPGGTIIEPTSGNTGIGLAMVAAVKGYKLVLVMPESMSLERRRLMLAYGASFDLTPREKGMKGAIARAEELIAETPGSWMPQQFENPANLEVHRRTTAREILEDFRDSPIDVLITGVGTGGHITACAEVLKGEWPGLKVYAVEPTLSPVLSGGDPGPHPIQGIGAGFIPAIMNVSLLDGIIQVDPADAKDWARRAAREEGLLVGISSGATLAAISQKLAEHRPGQARARLQLRHRRALSLGAGLPARGGMSARIAILTPDPDDRDFHSRWRDVLEEEAALLRRAGLAVEDRAWTRPADFAAFDLILPLLTWGYCRAAPAWRAAVDDWAARGLPVLNPPSVLAGTSTRPISAGWRRAARRSCRRSMSSG